MKLIEQHLIEKYEERFTIEQLVEAGIPKLYLKMEAVKKVIKELEANRKKVVAPYNTEKDPTKKVKLLNILKDLTKKINARRTNLIQMQDMEDKYVSNLGVDDELKLEDTDIGHQDNEPGMLRADLSTIERYADELGEMMAEFEESGKEIDFPHWWQTKVIKAKDYLIGAKHYLRAELEKGK
jgi:predicted MPP superfamily phosphohydrolase|tara:strand:+ start:867 stop:1412 length:546 start_codon:yes stop_codon:yes gene_type:complete